MNSFDVLSIVVSYLDRCEDLRIGKKLYELSHLTHEEEKKIDLIWLKESHIVVGKGQPDKHFNVRI